MALKLHPQFLLDKEGKRRSVLLSIEEFEAMLEELEDYADSRVLREVMETSTPEDFEDWEVVKEELRKLGKIK